MYCLEICELDPARIFTSFGLAWKAVLKKTKIKLDLLTDIDTLLLVEKDISERICYATYQFNIQINALCKIQ